MPRRGGSLRSPAPVVAITGPGCPVSSLDAIKAAIKAELKADGCTQADLAAYLGLSQKHVSQILTGKCGGSHEVIEAMARAVGLSLRVAAGES